MNTDMRNLQKLEDQIGYTFRDASLLENALVHTSYYNEHRNSVPSSNERLEFLGDSVLELVSSDYIYLHHPKMPEGEMTKLRASKVCEPALAWCARRVGLDAFILLGKGEEQNGGRKRDSIVSDAFESVIGAIYLDGGFTNAKEFILKHVMIEAEKEELFCDGKTVLQEVTQKMLNGNPEYVILSSEGPDHAKTYVAAVMVNGREYARGCGSSKKAAEQDAAAKALVILNSQGNKR